jgi:hypothetical protein
MELKLLVDVIVKQNYFQHNLVYYKQVKKTSNGKAHLLTSVGNTPVRGTQSDIEYVN